MSRKALIITDDEPVEAEELNPFSFKQFLRSKDQEGELDQDEDQDKDEDQGRDEDQDQEQTHREELSGTQLSPPPTEEEEESRGAAGDGTSLSEPDASCSRSSLMRQLQEENTTLRRSLKEAKRSAAASEKRASQLCEELQQTRRREEKEAQDLESMVQRVEHNLTLMTRRAVKAENNVSKLKLELQQLQAECDSLKTAESQVVMTMRQNAQVASEYLKKTTSNAHSSLQKLYAEAESLRLVSEFLHSIEKISAVHTES